MSYGMTIREVDNALVNEAGVSCRRQRVEERKATVIVNADDWGRDSVTTDRAFECFCTGAISSVSAMVFMADSERAAEMAQQHGMDAGLHLNFTQEYSTPRGLSRLIEHQQEIARVLSGHRYAATFYHPRLTTSFEYVVKAQVEEYERLYGIAPQRLDGHHHMHLCANVMCQKLLPSGTIVRRNLSFGPGEKNIVNRLYRRVQDQRLTRRHRLADYFFDLHPVEPSDRLRRIFALGAHTNVEIETHPARHEEYAFLMSDEFQQCSAEVCIANGYVLIAHASRGSQESLA